MATGSPTASALPTPEVRPRPKRWAAARARWPRRRLLAVAALAPALLVLLVGGAWTTNPAWTGVVAAVALTSAVTLASYVPLPGTGAKLDVGCSPCAAMAGLGVVAAALLVDAMPQDVATALVALAASGFALRQRLTDPAACPTPRR